MPHEKPILFSRPMIHAILEGTKSQTRREVKPSNSTVNGYSAGSGSSWPWVRLNFAGATVESQSIYGAETFLSVALLGEDGKPMDADEETRHRVRPKWEAGDHLWCRETFAPMDGGGVERTIYRADDNDASKAIDEARGWKPSIFMPRSRSRITLEIVGVRVERLQDISEEDAIAEGCSDFTMDEGVKMWSSAIEAYGELWDSINGDGAWNKNPYVWAISFDRLTPGPRSSHPAD